MKTKTYLTQNSKIKKMSGLRTFNWGIPAFKEKRGRVTCPAAGQCGHSGGCYALQGTYIWSNVAQAFQARYELSLTDKFVPTLDAEIKRRNIERVRIHDSGDFYSKAYLDKWIELMKLNPKIKFYAYTKMVRLFQVYKNKIPSNFTVIFSYGGTQDKYIDATVDRHSLVFETVKELKSAGYIDASKDDSNALKPNHRVGLVYHGAKSKKWTGATAA